MTITQKPNSTAKPATPSGSHRAAPAGRDGQRRVLIEGVAPELEGGRYPIQRTVGEMVTVEADLVAEGHDILGGAV
ncbi:maltotransferase domain-containing protein, partial [Myxococcota bacterium]